MGSLKFEKRKISLAVNNRLTQVKKTLYVTAKCLGSVAYHKAIEADAAPDEYSVTHIKSGNGTGRYYSKQNAREAATILAALLPENGTFGDVAFFATLPDITQRAVRLIVQKYANE